MTAAVAEQRRSAAAATVSVLIVHEGDEPWRLRATLDALDGIETSTCPDVIVVDDGSRGVQKPDVKSRRGLQVLVNEERIGFASSINRAAAVARGAHLLLLRPGVEASWSAIVELLAAMEEDRRLAAAAPAVRVGDVGEAFGSGQRFTTACSRIVQMMTSRRRAPVRHLGDGAYFVEWADASALLLRASTFRALCGFDEAFVERGAEEDWCWRAGWRGYRVGVVPKAIVEDVQFGARAEAGWTTAAGHRAALRFVARRSGWFAALVYRLTMSVVLLSSGVAAGLTGRRRGVGTGSLLRCLWTDGGGGSTVRA